VKEQKAISNTVVLLRLAGFVLVVILVVTMVDLAVVARLLFSVSLAVLVAGLLLVQAQIVLSATRWQWTARRLGHVMVWPYAVCEYYLASFLNATLPTGLAGDFMRMVRAGASLRPHTPSPDLPPDASPDVPPAQGKLSKALPAPDLMRPVVRAIVLERLAGQVSFFALAVLGLFFAGPVLGMAWLNGQAVMLAGTLALLVVLVVLFVRGNGLRPAAGRLAFDRLVPAAVRQWIRGVGHDVRRAWFVDGAWRWQLLISLVIASCYLAVFWLAAAGMGALMTPAQALVLLPLTLVAMLLPISFGGFGPREGVAVVLWPMAGFSTEQALAASLVYGAISLAGALPGAAVLVLRPSSRA